MLSENWTGSDLYAGDPPSRPLDVLTAAVNTDTRTDTWYDQVGNVVATVDPRGVWTRTYYDKANRPVATLQNWTGSDLYGTAVPEGNPAISDHDILTEIGYNSDGYRDIATDPLGHKTKYEYNHVGQLLKTVVNYVNGGEPQNENDQRNITTSYVYDTFGRQIQTTDTLGHVTLNFYDDLGRTTA